MLPFCAVSSILFCIIFFFPSTEALSRLNNVIRHPNALQSDNVMAYDNAVSALGKICQFHRDSIDSAQVFLVFNYSPSPTISFSVHN